MAIASKCRFLVAVLLLFLDVVSHASDPSKPTDLPDGTTLVVRLEHDVRADRLKPGDEVRAKVVAPAIVDGAVAIPAEASVTAVVLGVEPLAAEHPSRLVLLFRLAHWPNAMRTLHAYIARQLVLKRDYSLDTRPFCPPGESFKSPQAIQAGITATLPMTDVPDCRIPLGSERADARPLTFISPAMVGVVLRKLLAPRNAVALEAARAQVFLRKGMMLEIRHSAE